jgi:tetratricopeptide (TPR) repeat protein
MRTLQLVMGLAGAFLSVGCGLTARRAFDRGTKLYEKGQYAEASIEFRSAIQKDPKFGEAYLKLGLTELKQKKSIPAADALRHAMALMPDRSEPKAELAEIYINTYLADPRNLGGLYQQASQFTNELLSKDPNSFSGLRLKGYLAIADNKPKEAIENFGRANQAEPNRPDVVSMLVQNLFRDGQSEPGESLAATFLETHKDYGPLYDMLYAHYMELKRPADAENILKRKIANNPGNSFFVTQLCRHYWSNGKREQAIPLLREITARPDEFPNGRLDAGNFYADNGDWNDAVQAYQAGIQANTVQANPKDKLAYQKRLATVLLSAGRRVEAEKVLDEILTAHPDDDDALASRAALRVASGIPGELDHAIADFKSLVERQPSNIKNSYQLGRAYEQKGAEDAARAQYLAILRINNRDVATLDSLSHLYLREQRYADAKRYAEMWLAIDSLNPSALLVQSASLAGLGDYEHTRAVLAKLTHDYPDLEGAYLQLGLLDVQEMHFDEAEAILRRHYKSGHGDVRLLKGIVEMYAARSQSEKAIPLIQKEVDAFPESAELHRLLAETAGRAGRVDLAIEEYQKVRQMLPASAEIPLELGLLYDAKGQFDQALHQFEVAHKMNAKDPLPPALLGKVLEQTGRREEAVANYRESLRLDPGNASVMNNLAFALAETNGDLNEALQMALQAVQKSQGNPEFTDTLGWVYLQKKDIPSALHIFQNLRQKQPQNASFRIHLAMAFLQSGDRTSAHHELAAAERLHPSPQEQSEIKQVLSRL